MPLRRYIGPHDEVTLAIDPPLRCQRGEVIDVPEPYASNLSLQDTWEDVDTPAAPSKPKRPRTSTVAPPAPPDDGDEPPAGVLAPVDPPEPQPVLSASASKEQ